MAPLIIKKNKFLHPPLSKLVPEAEVRFQTSMQATDFPLPPSSVHVGTEAAAEYGIEANNQRRPKPKALSDKNTRS